jgi:hypothetical protein
MPKLHRSSYAPASSVNGGSIKYFIKCTPSSLSSIETIDAKAERAILSAVLNDGHVRKSQNVVVKLGISRNLKTEYSTASKLYKKIPGFVKYICGFECPDDVARYSNHAQSTKPASLCLSSESGADQVYVLVMPHIAKGSMLAYSWNTRNFPMLKSCLKQVVLSLATAFEMFGFLHSDVHLENILIRSTSKEQIAYDIANVSIPSHGVQVCIMDLEYAFMNARPTETIMFFKDIKHLFSDISYRLKLDLEGFNAIETFLLERTFKPRALHDAYRLLPMIDAMVFKGVQKPRTIEYDPNVFGGGNWGSF